MDKSDFDERHIAGLVSQYEEHAATTEEAERRKREDHQRFLAAFRDLAQRSIRPAFNWVRESESIARSGLIRSTSSIGNDTATLTVTTGRREDPTAEAASTDPRDHVLQYEAVYKERRVRITLTIEGAETNIRMHTMEQMRDDTVLGDVKALLSRALAVP